MKASTAPEATRTLDGTENKVASRAESGVLSVTWPIDGSLDLGERPMSGQDIQRFRARHRLQTSDAIYALGFANAIKYKQACQLPALPFTLELLMRLYDQSPGHAGWIPVGPQDAYRMLYGSIEQSFARSPFVDAAKTALYRRFTGGLGRSVMTAYRWLQGQGNATTQISKIFSKLSEAQSPRQTLESTASLMYKARRHDFDLMYPLPTLKHPPVAKRRGRPKATDAKS